MEYKVALTGATGFIGKRVARRLVANGCKLQALARATSDRSSLSGFNIHWVEGTLEDPDSLGRLVRGADAVVHCAGAVRGATQAHFDRLNVDGAARLVRAAVEQHPVPLFLLISSLAAREPVLSHYAASKRQAETVLAEHAGRMPWAVLRPPAVYGPGDREMLPLFRWMTRGISPLVGSDNSRVSLLYVDDLAEAVIKWLQTENCSEAVFELHDWRPKGYLWQDVIDTIEHLTGKHVRSVKVPLAALKIVSSLNLHAARIFRYAPMFTPGKLRELRHPDWVCDNTALTRETGWTPRVSLEEGLRRTLEL
jgi:nucleoside-diphosphate-sugar epimerase